MSMLFCSVSVFAPTLLVHLLDADVWIPAVVLDLPEELAVLHHVRLPGLVVLKLNKPAVPVFLQGSVSTKQQQTTTLLPHLLEVRPRGRQYVCVDVDLQAVLASNLGPSVAAFVVRGERHGKEAIAEKRGVLLTLCHFLPKMKGTVG